jgi:hypothetical protein
MANKVKKAKLQQFKVHEVVEGKNWQDADKILTILLQRTLDQFDNWRRTKKGAWKTLNINGPNTFYGQLRDVGAEMRGICTIDVMYEE